MQTGPRNAIRYEVGCRKADSEEPPRIVASKFEPRETRRYAADVFSHASRPTNATRVRRKFQRNAERGNSDAPAFRRRFLSHRERAMGEANANIAGSSGFVFLPFFSPEHKLHAHSQLGHAFRSPSWHGILKQRHNVGTFRQIRTERPLFRRVTLQADVPDTQRQPRAKRVPDARGEKGEQRKNREGRLPAKYNE